MSTVLILVSDTDFKMIQIALYHHQVVVFKNQGHLSPKAQYEVTQRFDPAAAGAYGHGKTLDAKRSILHPDSRPPHNLRSGHRQRLPLFAVRVPGGRSQTLRYDDGTGDEKTVPLGTTAFVSGAAMYEALSPEDQAFCRGTKVEYAPHPYVHPPPCAAAPRRRHRARRPRRGQGDVHRLQRPGIAPEKVYAHDWEEGDFVIFHNRGVLHSVVGCLCRA
ncbi:alpha-ketoglutarate dependent xanthine dioxygenase [Verticillium dahliae]|nr:alpha-ketoglutarate dependent xanthine dioxygenase [Verticillium dahliae]